MTDMAEGTDNPLEILLRNLFNLSKEVQDCVDPLTVDCLKKDLIGTFDANKIWGPGFGRAAQLLTLISTRNADDPNATNKMELFMKGLSKNGYDSWAKQLKSSWKGRPFDALDENLFEMARSMMTTNIKPLVVYCTAEKLIGQFDPAVITTQVVQTDFDKAATLLQTIKNRNNSEVQKDREDTMYNFILALQKVDRDASAQKLIKDLEKAGFQALVDRLKNHEPTDLK